MEVHADLFKLQVFYLDRGPYIIRLERRGNHD